MSFDTTLEFFRDQQAEQFTDSATVNRPVGEMTYDPDAGSVQDYDEVYSGECKIRPADRSGNEVGAGQTEMVILDSTGKFPVDADLQKDDIVVVTASTYDAGMVGRQYRISSAPADGWQIARVTVLEETLVPALNMDSA